MSWHILFRAYSRRADNRRLALVNAVVPHRFLALVVSDVDDRLIIRKYA